MGQWELCADRRYLIDSWAEHFGLRRQGRIGMWLATLLVLSLSMVLDARAWGEQNEAAPATSVETYRLRVQNFLYGRVEVSVDGGRHYLLLGRVRHPAISAAPDSSAS